MSASAFDIREYGEWKDLYKREWYRWHEVVTIAREHDLNPMEILVEDRYWNGRWAANLQMFLYHVTVRSLRAARLRKTHGHPRVGRPLDF